MRFCIRLVKVVRKTFTEWLFVSGQCNADCTCPSDGGSGSSIAGGRGPAPSKPSEPEEQEDDRYWLDRLCNNLLTFCRAFCHKLFAQLWPALRLPGEALCLNKPWSPFALHFFWHTKLWWILKIPKLDWVIAVHIQPHVASAGFRFNLTNGRDLFHSWGCGCSHSFTS